MPAKALPKSRRNQVKRAVRPKVYIETNYTPHIDLWSSAPAAVIPAEASHVLLCLLAGQPRGPYTCGRGHLPPAGLNARADAAIRLLDALAPFHASDRSRARTASAYRAYATARTHEEDNAAVLDLTMLADRAMQSIIAKSDFTQGELSLLTELRNAGDTTGFADHVTQITGRAQRSSGSSSADSGSNSNTSSSNNDHPDFDDPLVLWNFVQEHMPDADIVRHMEMIEHRERGSGSSGDSGSAGSRIRVAARSPRMSTPPNSLESPCASFTINECNHCTAESWPHQQESFQGLTGPCQARQHRERGRDTLAPIRKIHKKQPKMIDSGDVTCNQHTASS